MKFFLCGWFLWWPSKSNLHFESTKKGWDKFGSAASFPQFKADGLRQAFDGEAGRLQPRRPVFVEVWEKGGIDARLVFVHDVEGCWAGFGVCRKRG